ncbi:unnamed protein product [Triticum turgidum subsp. durum]|uniref:Uncharacterized protein n=1 Tax=Triticum turgidum subsp. durum TaxID=4567 RepID=A0A9R0XRD8_TRITD|nr:unnamed protein product [Triticum turgidum subsp. durum]
MGILVIAVDLQCCRCKKKINDVLKCLQEDYCIEKIEYEHKANKVIVRGKFDAEKLRQKILCKACKVVQEIIIVDVWPPPRPTNTCVPEPQTPKRTCKFVPCPCPMPYPMQCYLNCPPQQCLCCPTPMSHHHGGCCCSSSKPALPPPCNWLNHRGCTCSRQPNWPPPTCPPLFPPLCWIEECPRDPCSIM